MCTVFFPHVSVYLELPVSGAYLERANEDNLSNHEHCPHRLWQTL